MSKVFSQMIRLLFAVCLIAVILPVAHANAATLDELKQKFPNGAYWNHAGNHYYGGYGHCVGSCNNPDGYTWSPCYTHNGNTPSGAHDCNSFNGGIQCCGFARKLAYDAYGSYATNWTNYYGNDASNYMWNSLKPGDVLHYTGGNADPTYGHWVFVIGVNGNAITVAECNIYNAPCQIRWGNVIYKGNINAAQVCVAPSALGNSSTSAITWSDSAVDPSQTDAYVAIRANAPYSGTFGTVGITVWDASGKVVAQKEEASSSDARTFLNIWYNLTAETGAVLKPNAKYTYQFHVYFNNTLYKSDVGSFTTDSCSSHKWNNGVVTKQPTTTQTGVRTYTCTACGTTKTEKIPVLVSSVATPSKPTKIVNNVTGPRIYWKAVTGATSYSVWRSDSGKTGVYKKIGTTTATNYLDTTVESGKIYYYAMVARNSAGSESGLSDSMGIAFVNTPDITSRINSAYGIKLGWQQIKGATGYRIYRKNYNGTDEWKVVGEVSGNATLTWTDKSVAAENGTIYKYTIRALYGNTISGCHNGRTMVRLASRNMLGISSPAVGQARCTWSTASNLTGYEVRFMMGSTVVKKFTIGNSSTRTKIFTGIPSGGEYKVQVRSYKTVSGVGAFYSAWSAPAYVTVK